MAYRSATGWVNRNLEARDAVVVYPLLSITCVIILAFHELYDCPKTLKMIPVICARCGEEKPAVDFVSKKTPAGTPRSCSSCRSQRTGHSSQTITVEIEY